MRTALRIFVRDFKRIARNPVAVIIAFGVCVIPSLYAWINILANWDPYNNTSTVPVAVTIEDQGADIPGIGYTNAGDLVRDQLEQNTQLGWTFVDEDQAVEGVRSGRYYAAFVLPSDFTSSLADVLEGNTEKAHIAYYVNEKVNAISPKVADTGATTLEDQISQQFVSTVGTTITEKLKDGVTEAAAKGDEANATLTTNLRDTQATLSGLADNLEQAQGTIDGTRGTVGQARDTLGKLSGTTTSLSGTLSDALGTLGDTRTKAQTLTAQLAASLGTSLTTISGISSTANYDIGAMAGHIGWATGKLDAAIAQIEALNNTTKSLKGTLETTRTTIANIKLPDGSSTTVRDQVTTQLDQDIELAIQLSDSQQAALDRLKAASADVKQSADTVANLSSTVNNAIQSTTSSLTDLQKQLAGTTMPQISSSLDSFSDAGGKLSGTAGALGPMLSQADATLAELDGILSQSAQTLGQTVTSVRGASDKVGSLADDVAGLQSIASYPEVAGILGLDPDGTGSFLGTPVQMQANAIFPVENYGSGMTPFYTNLGLWVGGFVLVAIYKLEVDREGIGAFKPWQGFLGRWLLMVMLGLVQGLICSLGDLALGIQCLDPVAFVFAALTCSFVYVSLIYSISIAFKHIGKAIGVLLVILQIPGASGTYPIQLQPDFFQALYPWLPFTYGINAMREAIAGFYGTHYVQALLVLLLYLVPSVLIGITARRHLLNINALFDRRLGETDMMVTERVGMKGSYFRLSTIVKVLMDSGSYRTVFLRRAAQFELAYPMLVRRGFWALVVIPLALVVLLFVLPAKFLLLMLWIASCVFICTYLIVVEYFHSRVGQKTALANMSRAELYDLLDDELRSELMAFAPIEKMRLDRATREQETRSGGATSPDDTAHIPGAGPNPQGDRCKPGHAAPAAPAAPTAPQPVAPAAPAAPQPAAPQPATPASPAGTSASPTTLAAPKPTGDAETHPTTPKGGER